MAHEAEPQPGSHHDGQAHQTGAIGKSVAGVAVGGGILLGAGVRRSREAKWDAREKAGLAVLPVLDVGTGAYGVGLRGAF